MRAEKDNKTALTVTYRKRDMLFGLVGGKCEKCGTAQFPRTRICVNPNCNAVDQQKPFSFAELEGKVLSWSADFLTYSQDPPQHYGMVTFEEGGRFLADFTDVDVGTVDTGSNFAWDWRKPTCPARVRQPPRLPAKPRGNGRTQMSSAVASAWARLDRPRERCQHRRTRRRSRSSSAVRALPTSNSS
jgi:uncharacterized OB-fold protein